MLALASGSVAPPLAPAELVDAALLLLLMMPGMVGVLAVEEDASAMPEGVVDVA